MTSDSEQVLCYNKGCGKKFDLNNNGDDACQYHPGHPVFHDALKGWSCCNKKSTDFSTFLSYPGCTKGPHSNVKPVEPEKPQKTVENNKDDMYVYEAPKIAEMTPRPTENEPLIELKRTIAPSLTTALEKITESIKNTKIEDNDNQTVAVGTPCKNATCQARYESENSNNEKCTYHPGVAIFHEGMKYWSCCQRKTSDFDNFLSQVGCTEGKHLWIKQQTQEEKVDCRFDHHQAGGYVIVTVYSKNSVPDKSSIRANRIKLDINLSFEAGIKSFVKEIELYGVIDLEQSSVNFFQTKVEIKLKKVDAANWPKLFHVA